MTQAQPPLVGNTFRLGYRFQRYWDTSMALAFFSAEVGSGLFFVSSCLGLTSGMVLGLVLVGTLKPYFHLAHMGVPHKSWRAILRPDRSWTSRGLIGISLLIAFGALHVLDRSLGLVAAAGLPAPASTLIAAIALTAAILVMCYQGLAMADSESFALWANPMIPLMSLLYALTTGTLLAWWLGAASPVGIPRLSTIATALLACDFVAIGTLLALTRRKSAGGAFSVALLTRGEYAWLFLGVVVAIGLVVPLVLVQIAGASRLLLTGAVVALLVGFLALRLLLFRAAVFEPIIGDLAGSLGLPIAR